ncbi:uncharacterized protein BDR25DRAFT_347735 [Lindgomyces ingoldianus]|uniref:Uncharacterized protein n=1 Tax=Lindgomyces ingoldianus TaxID=673940 RepID=A0ACB6RE95_9PLEO|nr:uncharacterized protein BDR25DRAFT_347735 [Lindgomyces ingoldianus]KAF2477360.1 hypothetical protein BDR25DRAFT_347735 [Lindgomyces ingoldianus]
MEIHKRILLLCFSHERGCTRANNLPPNPDLNTKTSPNCHVLSCAGLKHVSRPDTKTQLIRLLGNRKIQHRFTTLNQLRAKPSEFRGKKPGGKDKGEIRSYSSTDWKKNSFQWPRGSFGRKKNQSYSSIFDIKHLYVHRMSPSAGKTEAACIWASWCGLMLIFMSRKFEILEDIVHVFRSPKKCNTLECSASNHYERNRLPTQRSRKRYFNLAARTVANITSPKLLRLIEHSGTLILEVVPLRWYISTSARKIAFIT